MTLFPAQKELPRLHCCPEKRRGAHSQAQCGAVGGRVIDVDHPVALFEQWRFLNHMTNAGHYESRPGTSWEVNDIAAAFLFKPAKQFHCAADASGKGPVFHCAANLNVAASIREVENVALDFDARHFFAEVDSPSHTPSPTSAEQLGIGLGTSLLSKPVTNVVSGANHISFGVLPCAPRAAVRLPINRRPEFPAVPA